MNVAKVEYRPIKNHPGYRVGNDGSVWTRRARGSKIPIGFEDTGKDWRRLSVQTKDCGHLVVGLSDKFRVRRNHFVHILVLEAFVGPKPLGMQACHFPDRNPKNNQVKNLQWGTPEQNRAHMVIHGTSIHGLRGPNVTITPSKVRRIRLLRKTGLGYDSIADRIGVSKNCVRRVAKGETWGWLE